MFKLIIQNIEVTKSYKKPSAIHLNYLNNIKPPYSVQSVN